MLVWIAVNHECAVAVSLQRRIRVFRLSGECSSINLQREGRAAERKPTQLHIQRRRVGVSYRADEQPVRLALAPCPPPQEAFGLMARERGSPPVMAPEWASATPALCQSLLPPQDTLWRSGSPPRCNATAARAALQVAGLGAGGTRRLGLCPESVLPPHTQTIRSRTTYLEWRRGEQAQKGIGFCRASPPSQREAAGLQP